MNEDELYNILLKEKESGKINITSKKLEVIPNYKLKDSPDFVLKITLNLSLLSQTFELEIPVPIELERVTGINGALNDLQKFIEREKFNLILPMPIISEKRIISREKKEKLKTKFKLRQIPERLVK